MPHAQAQITPQWTTMGRVLDVKRGRKYKVEILTDGPCGTAGEVFDFPKHRLKLFTVADSKALADSGPAETPGKTGGMSPTSPPAVSGEGTLVTRRRGIREADLSDDTLVDVVLILGRRGHGRKQARVFCPLPSAGD